MFIRNAWYVAAWADEIGEAPLARRICNEPVVLFRDRQNRVAALLDMCCHRGAPLHMGKVVEEGLQCGYHGLIFDRSGTCVRVPGQEHILERTRVRSFPVVEQDAFVWIWMGDPAKADRIHDRALAVSQRREELAAQAHDVSHQGRRHADGGQPDGPDASRLRPHLDHRRKSVAARRGEDADRAHAARAEVHPLDAEFGAAADLREGGGV